MLLSAISMRRLSCLSSTSRAMSWIALSLNTDTARAIAPTSSRSARKGITVVVSWRARRVIAWVMRPSRDSTRCMVARPIGPIRTIATNAHSSTHTASDVAVELTKAMFCCASLSRRSR